MYTKHSSKEMRADKKSMRDAGVLSTEGLWMTFTAVHHQLY